MPRPPGASLDSSPIPGGQRGSLACFSSLGMHLPHPLLHPLQTRPPASVDPPAISSLPGPLPASTLTAGEKQVPDLSPTPSPDPPGTTLPEVQGRTRACEGQQEGDFPGQGKRQLPKPFLEAALARPRGGAAAPDNFMPRLRVPPSHLAARPPPRPPNFPAEVCARPGPGRCSARPPDGGREGGRRKTESSRDPAGEPAREGAREPASERTRGPRRGLTMARGADASGGGDPRAPQPRRDRRALTPAPARSPRRDAQGASYLGGGGGRAPGCGLRRSRGAGSRAGEGPGRAGAGTRGSRGAGSPGTAARRPAAPPHLQLGQGRWPRRPGRAGMS